MNIYNSRNVLFALFLCLTLVKDVAKSTKTKITDTSKQTGLISLLFKPFQVNQIKRVEMESIQKQRVADKKTTFSLQWQDMKSHFLIPISKTHIHVYTDETIGRLNTIKKAFFEVLGHYAVKLQTYYNSKSLEIEEKYKVQDNSAFNEEKDLIAQTSALHREMASLLIDLPQRLMYWTETETLKLKWFALILGPLRETGGTQIQKEQNPGNDDDVDDWGDDYDDDYGNTFGGEDVGAWGEGEDNISNDQQHKSDIKSSDSSDSSSGSDYDTEFFDNLPPEYFLISDDESVPHVESSPDLPFVHSPPLAHSPPSGYSPPSVHSPPSDHSPPTVHFPPSVHSPPPVHSPSLVHSPPSDDYHDENGTIHDDLRAIEKDSKIDWELERALAREEQLTQQESHINLELIELRNKLLESVLRMGGIKALEELLGEKYPEHIAVIERLKEQLESKKNQKSLKPQPSHSSESPSHPRLGDNESNGNFDNSIQGSSPTHQEVNPIPHSDNLSGDKEEGKTLTGKNLHLEIKGTMTVEQQKQR